jgi:Domain of unknown function (DUF4340)
MNRKQFAILVVLLVVLGGAGLLIVKKQRQESGAGEAGAGKNLLGEKFPVNDITQITLKTGTNALNLVKKDDVWKVSERANYAANFSQISEELIKLAGLKVAQVEEVGASQLARLELTQPGPATNSGTLVDLKDKDGKTMKSLTLGKKHMQKPQHSTPTPWGDEGYPDGRYVMVSGNSQEALLIKDPLDKLEAKPAEWLQKDFFHIERPKAIAVTFPVATNSWKITRDVESGEWKLAEAKPEEKLDTTKVPGVANPFSSPSFNDVVLPGAKPEDNGLDKPTVVTVDTFDDFTYVVKVGTKNGDEYPVKMTVTANFPNERVPAKDEKPEDKDKADKAWKDRQKQLETNLQTAQAFAKWTYLVPSYNVDPMLKERKDLLEEKKEEKKPDAKPAEKTTAAADTKTVDTTDKKAN